jgi:hypothetical protein
MVEKKFTADIASVFALLTNPRWLEQRSLDLGELAATAKVKKSAKGVHLSMQRRIRRNLPALIAKVLSTETDMTIEQGFVNGDEGYSGSLTLELAGQPVKIGGDFTLTPASKGCIYRIQHTAKCSVPLIGGTIEKFAVSEVDKGCLDELDYLANYLKKHK